MTKDDRDESLLLNPLLGERSIALADASTRRGLETLTGHALERCGVTSQVAKAMERGLSAEQAIEKVLPKARGIVAEETVAAVFNREAGLVSSPLTASRFELPNDPLRDLVVRDAGGNTVQACQLKFGKQEYVQRAALSGKYSGPIVTSQEAAAALDGRLPPNAVTPTLKAGMVTTQPVTDAEVTATARRVLERRFRRIKSLSSWHAFGSSLKESAPAGIGAAVLTASHEVYQAVSTQQPVKVDRVFRASVKAGARAMLVDQLGRLMMQFLEQRMLQAGGWTQAAIKKAAGWATPASALSTLLVDVAMSFCQLLTRGRPHRSPRRGAVSPSPSTQGLLLKPFRFEQLLHGGGGSLPLRARSIMDEQPPAVAALKDRMRNAQPNRGHLIPEALKSCAA